MSLLSDRHRKGEREDDEEREGEREENSILDGSSDKQAEKERVVFAYR